MQLDSKESDIEQLREKLNDLQLRMDNSSVTSLQTDETDSNLAGRVTTDWMMMMLPMLLHIRKSSPRCRNPQPLLSLNNVFLYLSRHWCSLGIKSY